MLNIILDLLPFIASVVLIFVFRYIDRDNRSLEKVKKFTDTVKSDFDSYFKENSQKILNVGTELETKQSQAIAAITRLESIQNSTNEKTQLFQEKAESISMMEEKISHYDEVLNDLIEMTANVEENLQRLQTESRFLDKATKKINSQKNLLDSLENRIPSVVSEFTSKNKEELQLLFLSLTNHEFLLL
jgi:Tfp pilus assembly protein PilN